MCTIEIIEIYRGRTVEHSHAGDMGSDTLGSFLVRRQLYQRAPEVPEEEGGIHFSHRP